ncbi:MAG: DJ-1/PfpI family protein [Myxococcota bacterium]
MELTIGDDIIDVGIVVFEGVQIIDYTGPYEVFGQASYRVFTISESGQPLTTAMGMRIHPTYSFKDSPNVDVLVIPGGNIHSVVENKRSIDWIRDRAKISRHVLSVCNGAFILAKTGLLDDKKATTFHRLLDQFESSAQKTKVVWDQRFVDNGKIVTTAGLSSGIDGALHLISKLDGQGTAKSVALHLEYDWRPEENYARAALADMHLPRIPAPNGAQIKIVKTKGTKSEWVKTYRLTGKDARRASAYFYEQLRQHQWKQDSSAKQTTQQRTWRFEDRHGRKWSARTFFSHQNDVADFRIESRLLSP